MTGRVWDPWALLRAGRGAGPAAPRGEEAELGVCFGMGVRSWPLGSLAGREAERVHFQHLC